MIESNRPINPVHKSSEDGLINGMMWGALKGAGVGGAYSAANQYMLKGNLEKMGKIDGHIPVAAEYWRANEMAMREYDTLHNVESEGKGLTKQKSPLAKMAYNSTFGHGTGANVRRVGVSAALGAVMGGFHNQSGGIIG